MQLNAGFSYLFQDRLDTSSIPGYSTCKTKKFKCLIFCVCTQSSTSSGEDERFILNNKRPLTPLVLNPVHLSSSLDVFAPAYEPEVDVEREPIPRLPTPEERMRQQAKTVGADIVPINVTGRKRLRSRF